MRSACLQVIPLYIPEAGTAGSQGVSLIHELGTLRILYIAHSEPDSAQLTICPNLIYRLSRSVSLREIRMSSSGGPPLSPGEEGVPTK